MSTENWDEDVDSTQIILSAEDYAKCASPPKAYRDQQSGRRAAPHRSYDDNQRYGGGGGGGGDWGKSNGRSGQQDGGGGGGRWGNSNDRGGSSEDSMQIEIDPSKVGMVIGRGGSKIKEIQETFGVNVKVGEF